MIELKKISKTFNGRPIFEALDLCLESGKVYALVGKSGAGKTTLLNIIAGLEKCEGEVYFQGENLKKIPRQKFLAQKLSYLFQNFALMDNVSIEENLKLGLINSKKSRKEKRGAMLAAMKQTNIDTLNLKQKIYELSGGEAQRVALAKAILKNAPIILADEPTAALDLKNGEEIMNLLLGMRSDTRVIVLATHNPMIWEKADVVIDLSKF
jgi:putative ABC transport system ATP-binding protein